MVDGSNHILAFKGELPTLPEHLSSLPVFSEVRVTRSLVLYVCFVDRYLSLCTFSFGHCVVCSSSTYRFWLPLWYLQTLRTKYQKHRTRKKKTIHKRKRKPMGQSIMDNPKTLATIRIQDTGRRQRNNNNTKQKAIKVSNTDSTKHRTWTQVMPCYSYIQDAFDTTMRKQAQMMPCKIFHYLKIIQ